jgi:leader peptidase (prepilin peptidase)/N-methyltransferase
MMIPTVVTVVGQLMAPFLCYFTSWLLLPRESLVAGIGAWLIMWTISKAFLKIKKKEGLGLGDADIIALIAAYVGLLASIRIIFIASLMGLCFIIAYYVTTKKIINKLPFGPLLSLACVLHICFPHMFKIVLGW